MFIRFALVLVLLVMGIQDFRFRAISWYLFPTLAVMLLLTNPSFSWYSSFVNVGFIACVFILLTGWFSLRNGTLVNLTRQHLGIGDILFLLSLAFFFSPVNFFLFYLISLLLIAIGTGLYLVLYRPKDFSIPLAGLQGFVLTAVLMVSWIGKIDISNGDFIVDLLWSYGQG